MEKLLSYIWKHKLMKIHNLQTTDGIPLEIIDIGQINTDAGPDFFNAKIRIEGVVLAGNVEIHVLSSDWFKHGHDTNPAYNNVILHVVDKADKAVCCENGTYPPQLVLDYPHSIIDNYEQMQAHSFACQPLLPQLSPDMIGFWKNTLLIERLAEKAQRISALLEKTRNNWEEVLYLLLARYWGFGINNDAFEALALHTPFSIINKQRNNLLQLEALFLGQAGLLEVSSEHDSYVLQLQEEYRFLSRKYTITPIDTVRWKSHRMHPSNLPHVRIAQFASLAPDRITVLTTAGRNRQ